MAKKKAKQSRTRIRVAKVTAPAPDTRIVELEVVDEPTALPEPFVAAEPVPLHEQTGLLDWLRKMWR